MEAANSLFQRTLTLPTGALPPTPRIVLDGTNDVILVYGTGGALVGSFAATAGTDSLGNSYPAGLSVGSTAATHWTFDVTTQAFKMFDINALLNMVMSAQPGSDYFLWMDNIATTWQRFGASAISMGTLTTPGTIPTAQDISNSTTIALDTVSGNPALNILSPSTTSGPGSLPSRLELISGTNAGAGPGDPVNPVIRVGAPLSFFIDMAISGAVYRMDSSWQTPTLGANYNLTGTGGLFLIQYRFTENGRVRVYGAFNVGTAGTAAMFTVPSPYRPLSQGYLCGGTANSATVSPMTYKMSTAGVLSPTGTIATGLWFIDGEYELGTLP